MHNNRGFTLIELLTVVVILGILTSMALPQYRKSIQRASAANALINLKTIFDSAKRYKSSYSSWPTSFRGLDVELLDVSSDGIMGDFQYSFSSSNGGQVSACRLVGSSADSSYCLRADYRKNGQRDVYTCAYTDNKYQSLCESMGTCAENSKECVIE